MSSELVDHFVLFSGVNELLSVSSELVDHCFLVSMSSELTDRELTDRAHHLYYFERHSRDLNPDAGRTDSCLAGRCICQFCQSGL